MDNNRRLRIIKVSWEFLRDLMKLPEETEFRGLNHNVHRDEIEFLIENPSFTPIDRGSVVPPTRAEYPILLQRTRTIPFKSSGKIVQQN